MEAGYWVEKLVELANAVDSAIVEAELNVDPGEAEDDATDTFCTI